MGVRRRVDGDGPRATTSGEGRGRTLRAPPARHGVRRGLSLERPATGRHLMPTPVSAVALAAAVTLVVGLLGVVAVVALSRRSVGRAAVAAPVVVVIAVAAGVYASSRAMFLEAEDSRNVLLVLLAAVPVAA